MYNAVHFLKWKTGGDQPVRQHTGSHIQPNRLYRPSPPYHPTPSHSSHPTPSHPMPLQPAIQYHLTEESVNPAQPTQIPSRLHRPRPSGREEDRRKGGAGRGREKGRQGKRKEGEGEGTKKGKRPGRKKKRETKLLLKLLHFLPSKSN